MDALPDVAPPQAAGALSNVMLALTLLLMQRERLVLDRARLQVAEAAGQAERFRKDPCLEMIEARLRGIKRHHQDDYFRALVEINPRSPELEELRR